MVFPVDDLKGWAVGRGATIIHTEDGGLVWTPQESPVSQYLKDIFMFDDRRGFIVSTKGKILITQDGQTWQTVASPTSDDLTSIVFTDSLAGYCCGQGGTILRSLDGGQTWSEVSSGISADLNGMHFTSSITGWAVGSGGMIIKTEDGGTTWDVVTSPVSVDLTEVTFQGDSHGWASGLAGTIIRTEDGQTWQEVTTPVSDDLESVVFANQSVGWACGPGGTLIKTLNGGLTWYDLTMSPGASFKGGFFVDASRGWLVGSGAVFYTSDGGISWENQTYNIRMGDVNVVATIPGTTKPEEIYIICGHYDCISQIPYSYAPGADDNGTGTVAVIEAARVLKDYDFEATLRFVCFSREEQGLIGSGEYVEEAHYRGDSIMAAMNFDMIGYVDVAPEDIDVIYNDHSSWLADQYKDAADLYVPDLDVRKRYNPNAFYTLEDARFMSADVGPLPTVKPRRYRKYRILPRFKKK